MAWSRKMAACVRRLFSTGTESRDERAGVLSFKQSLEARIAEPLAHESQLLSHLNPATIETIFDIGAYDALDSLRYSRTFPKAKIYAFEALPANLDLCRRNIATVGDTRVVLVESALSDAEGKSQFYVSSGHPPGSDASTTWTMSSSLLAPNESKIQQQWGWLRFSEQINVNTTTVEKFCEVNQIDEIGLVHIDVQGAELRVLTGAGDRIKKIRAIWLEVSSQQFYEAQVLAGDLSRFLIHHGYERVVTFGSEPQWDELWIRLGNHP